MGSIVDIPALGSPDAAENPATANQDMAGYDINDAGVVTADAVALQNQGELRLYEGTGGGTNKVTVKAPATLAADYTLTLPVDDGTSNQVLTTDGAGVLSWSTPSDAVSSVNGQTGAVVLQVNDLAADGTTTTTIVANVADGASAVAVVSNNQTTLSTPGAKIHSFQNNDSEKAYIDFNGSYVQNVNWTSYTPSGTWSTNTTYVGKYVIINKTVFCSVEIQLSGAPTAATLTSITLPVTIDTTKLTSTSGNLPIGYGAILDSGTAHYPGIQALYKSSTTFEPIYTTVSGANVLGSGITQLAPITFASGDRIFFNIVYPI